MKILKTMTAAMVILMLGMTLACNNKDKNNNEVDLDKVVSLSDIKDATMADSLAYLLGESVGVSYWELCKQDTTLAGKDKEKLYKEGFAMGVKEMQSNTPYAVAYATAAMVCQNLNDINAQYKMNIGTGKLVQGLAEGLKGKNAVDPVKMNSMQMQLETRMQALMSGEKPGQCPPSLADSIAYAMGQSTAVSYWQISEQDSTLSGPGSNQEYRKGFEAGVKDYSSRRAYVIGYSSALVAGEKINSINKSCNLNLSLGRLGEGFVFAMQSREAVDPIKLRSALTALEAKLGQMMSEQQVQNSSPEQKQANEDALKVAADRGGANRTTPSGIRYKVEKAGQGASPVEGDIVTVAIAFKDLNGNIINTTKSEQSEYMSFPLTANDVPYKAMVEMLGTMKPGGRSVFYVPFSSTEGKVAEHIMDIKLSKVTKQ